jgi:hypothetical protein
MVNAQSLIAMSKIGAMKAGKSRAQYDREWFRKYAGFVWTDVGAVRGDRFCRTFRAPEIPTWRMDEMLTEAMRIAGLPSDEVVLDGPGEVDCGWTRPHMISCMHLRGAGSAREQKIEVRVELWPILEGYRLFRGSDERFPFVVAFDGQQVQAIIMPMRPST